MDVLTANRLNEIEEKIDLLLEWNYMLLEKIVPEKYKEIQQRVEQNERRSRTNPPGKKME